MCCVVKRLDGGFGQKETLSIYYSGGIVVTTVELTRTVCLVMTREEDTFIRGQSHPFDGRWTVGFNKSGKVLACDDQLFNDTVSTICCSNVVMDRGVGHFVKCYHLGVV